MFQLGASALAAIAFLITESCLDTFEHDIAGEQKKTVVEKGLCAKKGNV